MSYLWSHHRTGRRCSDRKCRGYLKDTIINFGDLLEEEIISLAEREAKKNDLCLSLGSSMQVYPACDLVGAGQFHCVTQANTLVVLHIESASPHENHGYAAVSGVGRGPGDPKSKTPPFLAD